MVALKPIHLPPELRSVVDSLERGLHAHDQNWIVSLMQQQGRLIVGLLWRMLGSEQDAFDAYHSTICRLIMQGPEAIGTNQAGYFYRTAMNTGIEMLRVRQRRQRHWPAVREVCSRRAADRADRSPGMDEDSDDVERLRSAIGRLPAHLRDVIVLRELTGLPYRQVASILGIGLATSRLYRRQAVLRLAAMLGSPQAAGRRRLHQRLSSNDAAVPSQAS
ncbi:MAG TPA: RNA polymerase sigma factor [Phycisphaerae bacterium]|nr:RNA polymerase sigma factor [Phycisphaerae bacterium]HOJ73090.1 RNA polymerase sigma factor [Phycisphaerae bacterium]HOM52706.1 RNA polymerase sigma factor [Phycisphaerae bacterium]HPP25472.1 RNA polymerase sigma factor [Phycisphaerae bacterium]HPZ97738.1 RNA polymerase sigma factor [Phycisphaerae bacterium]